jgi:hypothetical protein
MGTDRFCVCPLDLPELGHLCLSVASLLLNSALSGCYHHCTRSHAPHLAYIDAIGDLFLWNPHRRFPCHTSGLLPTNEPGMHRRTLLKRSKSDMRSHHNPSLTDSVRFCQTLQLWWLLHPATAIILTAILIWGIVKLISGSAYLFASRMWPFRITEGYKEPILAQDPHY